MTMIQKDLAQRNFHTISKQSKKTNHCFNNAIWKNVFAKYPDTDLK